MAVQHKKTPSRLSVPPLSAIQKEIAALHIPTSSYLGIYLKENAIHIAILGAEKITVHKQRHNKYSFTPLFSWLEKYTKTHNVKFIAAAISGIGNVELLGSQLWLQYDIVPIIVPANTKRLTVQKLVRKATETFVDNLAKAIVGKTNEVDPAWLTTLDQYDRVFEKQAMKLLRKLAKDFTGKRLLFINATPQGGGVAIMRHTLIRLYRLLGVDAHWHVLIERGDIFDITKRKFHNVLQAVADPKLRLTMDDKKLFDAWSLENAEFLKPAIKKADVIVIDDPQPAGITPRIKKINPKAKILYRSHIQIEAHLTKKPKTPQADTWNFIWNYIKGVDGFIAHPVSSFIPYTVDKKIVVTMPPAALDYLDGLNKKLSNRQKTYYLKLFNRILLESGQGQLDLHRPYIIQVARFDPAKGIPDVIESYYRLRKKLGKKSAPQLVICGNASIDDPDGVPLYNLTRKTITQKKYAAIAKDIKVAKLPPNDQMLNALLRESTVALQLSHKEGFEFKVSEALHMRSPVIAYRAGGIPLQIIHGKSGYLVNKIGDTATVTKHLYRLFTNDRLYQSMSRGAKEFVRRDISTVDNAIFWLYLALRVIKEGKLKTNGVRIYDLLPYN